MHETPSFERRLLDEWVAATEAGELSPFATINGAYCLGMATMAKAGHGGKEAGCPCRCCPLAPGREEDGLGQKQRQQGR